jgi:hypothetical protein
MALKVACEGMGNSETTVKTAPTGALLTTLRDRSTAAAALEVVGAQKARTPAPKVGAGVSFRESMNGPAERFFRTGIDAGRCGS